MYYLKNDAILVGLVWIKKMIWKSVKHFWKLRYGHSQFRLMDINVLVYFGLVGLLLIFFHKSVEYWPIFVLIHAIIVLLVLEIIRLGEKYPQKEILWFFRTMYPLPLFLFGWEELAFITQMFFSNYWMTDLIIRWDKMIFGVDPTVWVQKLYQPWLNELMHFNYLAYYSFFLLIPFLLYFRGKKQETFAVMSILTFTYFSNFFLFYFMPTLDPLNVPMLQAQYVKEQVGYFFAPLNQFVQAEGGIPVAAFPSSHVAGALVWVLTAIRYNRKVGYALLPLAVGIGFSVVYIQLHFALDPIFGYIWGAICFIVALKLLKKRGEDPAVLPGKSIHS